MIITPLYKNDYSSLDDKPGKEVCDDCKNQQTYEGSTLRENN